MSTELTELLDSLDMATYLDREGVRYRPTSGSRGPQLNVKDCPICGHSGWKVYLNAESGLGNCFAGDHPAEQRIYTKWTFIKAHLGVAGNGEVIEHIKNYAREQGWRPKRVLPAAVEKPADWQLPASYELPMNGKNLPYLERRGITADYVRYFKLRYAPKGSHYRYRVGAEWHFQDHGQRVIIPVFDLDGKLCTFQGRDVTGTQEPKYQFPPQLDASGAHLFNGYNVIPGTRQVVVGEGAFDVAAVKIAFDQDPTLSAVVPIGTFGKHLSHGGTNDQLTKFLELRRRGVEEVTFMWDGEVQATDDAITAGNLLRAYGFVVRVGMLPPDKDPNEVTGDVVRSTYANATPLDMVSATRLRMQRRRMNASV
jgi:DNA primase